MSYRPDFTVVSPDERVVLVVEAKAVARKDPRWAAELRHDIVTRASPPAAPFFIPPQVVADQRMSGFAFELAVFAWLGDLVGGGPETVGEPWAAPLGDIGLLDAVRGAEVRAEALA